MRKKLEYEKDLWNKNLSIMGFDEVGRGAIAGPLVVAGIVMKNNFFDDHIRDSKALNDKQRKKAYKIIKENAIFISVKFITVKEIEIYNPSKATELSILEIFNSLPQKIKPDFCLVDGKIKIKNGRSKWVNLIKGDDKSINIASASIIAKVSRDEYMENLHLNHNSLYKWNKNKGYPNKEHIKLIIENGIDENFHRKNYEPIKSINILTKQELKKKYRIDK